MQINFENNIPVFKQIAEEIANGIIIGAFPEESQIPSVAELSTMFKINPATALKGINILVDGKIVYKKRGVGMFVCDGARAILLTERKKKFYAEHIKALLDEALRIGISKEEIVGMINGGDNNG